MFKNTKTGKFSSIDKGINNILGDRSKNKKHDFDLMDSRSTIYPTHRRRSYISDLNLKQDKEQMERSLPFDIEREDVTQNKIRISKTAGKYVINKAPSRSFPSIKQLGMIYGRLPDDTKVPVVLETKKQYLKEYIQNQEKLRGIKFDKYERERYLKEEGDKLKPVVSRFTTYHNKYMPPRVVIFPTKDKKHVVTDIVHELGHEIEERHPKLQKEWNQKINPRTSPTLYGRTGKDEDFAESYTLFKLPAMQPITNPQTNKQALQQRYNLINKHIRINRDNSSRNYMDVTQYDATNAVLEQQDKMASESMHHKIFSPTVKDLSFEQEMQNKIFSDGSSMNFSLAPQFSIYSGSTLDSGTEAEKKGKYGDVKKPQSLYPDRNARNMVDLYHGTSENNIQSIREHGFKINDWQDGIRGVYVTPSKEYAGRYGKVLNVNLDNANIRNIGLNEMSKGLPLVGKETRDMGFDAFSYPSNNMMHGKQLSHTVVVNPNKLKIDSITQNFARWKTVPTPSRPTITDIDGRRNLEHSDMNNTTYRNLNQNTNTVYKIPLYSDLPVSGEFLDSSINETRDSTQARIKENNTHPLSVRGVKRLQHLYDIKKDTLGMPKITQDIGENRIVEPTEINDIMNDLNQQMISEESRKKQLGQNSFVLSSLPVDRSYPKSGDEVINDINSRIEQQKVFDENQILDVDASKKYWNARTASLAPARKLHKYNRQNEIYTKRINTVQTQETNPEYQELLRNTLEYAEQNERLKNN